MDLKKLECKVNAFIKDRCIINISHKLAVLKIRNKCVNFLIIVILYDEYDHCEYLDLKSIMNFKNNEISQKEWRAKDENYYTCWRKRK